MVMERESANTQAEKQIQGMKDLIESITEEANGRRIWNGESAHRPLLNHDVPTWHSLLD